MRSASMTTVICKRWQDGISNGQCSLKELSSQTRTEGKMDKLRRSQRRWQLKTSRPCLTTHGKKQTAFVAPHLSQISLVRQTWLLCDKPGLCITYDNLWKMCCQSWCAQELCFRRQTTVTQFKNMNSSNTAALFEASVDIQILNRLMFIATSAQKADKSSFTVRMHSRGTTTSRVKTRLDRKCRVMTRHRHKSAKHMQVFVWIQTSKIVIVFKGGKCQTYAYVRKRTSVC